MPTVWWFLRKCQEYLSVSVKSSVNCKWNVVLRHIPFGISRFAAIRWCQCLYFCCENSVKFPINPGVPPKMHKQFEKNLPFFFYFTEWLQSDLLWFCLINSHKNHRKTIWTTCEWWKLKNWSWSLLSEWFWTMLCRPSSVLYWREKW